MEEFSCADTESLYAKLKYQEKQLKLKRRWLMGVPFSDSEQKRLNRLLFQENKTFPESLLREDDVYYESIKAFIGKGFGTCSFERVYHVDQDNIQMSDFPNDLRSLSSMLDDMTNNGLQLFTELLTGGSTKFEKTRWKMKKIIREYLPKALETRKESSKINIDEQLRQLLTNPFNFRRNHATLQIPASQSYHAAATKVLDGLEDMPLQTLSAMHRKLRGIQEYVPCLQPPKSGWGRSILITQVRKRCMEMILELGEEDELQEPLAKAMAVGSLSAKLIQGSPFVAEFRQYSPQIKALQNEIAKAIWLLKEKVRFPELKSLQLLLDPNADLSNGSLRTAVKKLLTEYLFECSDMDTIPGYLLETLSIINRTSRSVPFRFFSEEEIQEEVECVLSVSAQLKQVLWDLLPEYEFDQDFADAYMEDLEESDCGDDNDENESDDQQEGFLSQDSSFQSHDPYDPIDTVGETNPAESESSASPVNEFGSSPVLTSKSRLNSDYFEIVEPEHVAGMDLVYSDASASQSSSEFDGLENMGGNEFHIGSVRNSELNDPLLLAQKTNGCDSSSHSSPDASLNGNHVTRQEPTVEPEKQPDFVSSNFFYGANFKHDRASMSRNPYLAVQEACDKTSMVAYRLIGRVLDEFAQIESLNLDCDDVSYLRGDYSIRKDSRVAKEDNISYEEKVHDSIVIQVLEDLLPSFPGSGKERLKGLMGLI
ncbi:uncharacterized protein LOC130776623 isoform X1 [Actinidia eriantha]|uniref:uncharacterized protein LOC130776623 isoform X1 n=2 Tax=Actinidia eriantha TaxID=165200 RepID=UPI00258832D1|nr:uncharacterized protein LOC130776623 isoform X1 [Actinidia eriantha]XP_057490880.1 uncharacterized protein LOC130776623 isoform X1 [Actinidia eriantha]